MLVVQMDDLKSPPVDSLDWQKTCHAELVSGKVRFSLLLLLPFVRASCSHELQELARRLHMYKCSNRPAILASPAL